MAWDSKRQLRWRRVERFSDLATMHDADIEGMLFERRGESGGQISDY